MKKSNDYTRLIQSDSDEQVSIKMGCVFPMVIIHILSQAKFGPNDHQGAPQREEISYSLYDIDTITGNYKYH